MTLFERIFNLLKGSGVWYELLEHEPVYTSQQAAAVRPDISLHQGAKAMVLKVRSSEFIIGSKDEKPLTTNNELITNNPFVMVVLPGDIKMDYRKVAKFLGAKDVTLATPEEVEQTIGVKIGAVSPFGNLSGLAVLVDSHLLENEKIAFNAGDHGKTVIMNSSDYQILSKAQTGDFTKSL